MIHIIYLHDNWNSVGFVLESLKQDIFVRRILASDTSDSLNN